MKAHLLPLPSNRVRRNYRGGAGLDRFEGRAEVRDSDRPEDWIASTVTARNPGLPPIPDEGLASVNLDGRPGQMSDDVASALRAEKPEDALTERTLHAQGSAARGGGTILFRDLLAREPAFYLGEDHFRRFGPDLGFLAKLLDSAMRLHVQAHPTAAFAREHLGSPFGKLETYVILGSRPGIEPYLRLGFQHLASPAEWRRIVFEQDIAAMDACFEKVPVRPGEVWVVPGGMPHAIGEGLTVIEVMEPSDLVVRCEFVREGIEVPPPARFMGRDPDFAMRIFDCVETPVEKVVERCRVAPVTLQEDPAYRLERLIGPAQTACFEVRKLSVRARCRIELDPRFAVAIAIEGAGELVTGSQRTMVRKSDRFFVAAATPALDIVPGVGGRLDLLLCLPGNSL